MGRKNEKSPAPARVRCEVCGHVWETIAEFPQCADPDEVCGRSRKWEYADDPDDHEADEQPEETQEPDDEQPGGRNVEVVEEPDETDDEADSEEPPDDAMVTQSEYESFKSGPTEPEETQEREADEQPDEQPPTGVLPVDQSTALMLLVVLAVVVAVALYLRKRNDSTDSTQTETVQAEPVETEPAESESEAVEAEPAADPIEDARRFDRRDRSEISLYE